ncbi:phosphoribosylaminoimidazolesuccinocarboxamide synthase [Nesterenkonia muleiensis]|uniref:phosphoribosylaminoimidazolesuccinocarboxamide synthase n=1 Tax=Nesterenkonia muleiensis TaxID=2282648 RepID=UPI000E738567|nr:phosphoribosylaminoimidazolesuccinocarboxamide synthase [Nesterenkonia muleiensis]
MSAAVQDTSPYSPQELPGWEHVSSGKVREIYAPASGSAWHGKQVLLMVATDRISAYDHVLTPGIPDKGVILTQLSLWWFQQLAAEGIGNHVVTAEVGERGVPESVAGRGMIVKRLEMVEAEAIVRGYLTGSGLAEYREFGTVNEIPLPAGLEDGSRLLKPIFTPSTKAEQGGHDENISFEDLEHTIGTDLASKLREASLKVYSLAEAIARQAGIILADTKFEFGLDEAGGLVLADEVLTPDSSRFWPEAEWEPGKAQPSFDKQFVRNWLSSPESGWTNQRSVLPSIASGGPEQAQVSSRLNRPRDRAGDTAPPPLPEHIVIATRDRYLDAYRRLTGTDLNL